MTYTYIIYYCTKVELMRKQTQVVKVKPKLEIRKNCFYYCRSVYLGAWRSDTERIPVDGVERMQKQKHQVAGINTSKRGKECGCD